MLTILVFFLPIIVLTKARLNSEAITIELYIFGVKIINLSFVYKEKQITINGKRLVIKKKKPKKKSSIIISPKIIIDLNFQFFLELERAISPSVMAISSVARKLAPKNLHISFFNQSQEEISLSVYGNFTIFKIIYSLLSNTKRKRSSALS